jgi:hypothetical protein
MKLAIEIAVWCIAISFVIGSLVPLVMFVIVGVQWLCCVIFKGRNAYR